MKNTLRHFQAPYRICWLLCALIIGLSLWLRSRLDLGSDVAVYLFFAEKILDGGRYYYDFFEFNLPLVFYIVAIPVFIARHLALSPILVFNVFITLVSVASMLLSARVLRGAKLYDNRPIYASLMVAACFAFFLPAPTLYSNNIGDKSLFMLAFILPYFFSCFPRKTALSKPLTVIVGVLAGLGFCLKPHYFIIWAGLELYLVCTHRRLFYGWRLMNFIIGGVTAAYLLCLLFVIPEYVEKILPIAPYLYFFKEGDTWLSILSGNIATIYLLWVWLVLVLFVLLTPRTLDKGTNEPRRLLLVGFILAYIELVSVHFQGFERVQLYAFGVLLVFPLVVDFARHLKSVSPVRTGIALPVLLVLLYFLPLTQIRWAYANKVTDYTFLDVTLPYAARYAKDKAVLALSPDAALAFPLINYSHTHWNYKFVFVPAWALASYQHADKSQLSPSEQVRLAEAEHYFYDALHYAFTHEPPAMIVALEKSPVEKSIWNFPENLLSDKVFVQEWKHYKKIDEVTRTDSYNNTYTIGIYKRI